MCLMLGIIRYCGSREVYVVLDVRDNKILRLT